MRTFFFTLILSSTAVYAKPLIPETLFQKKIDLEPQEDELVVIERVIKATENRQRGQEEIKKLIVQMRQEKELFMKNPESKLHAAYLVQTATKIFFLIREHHLEHLFSSDFLEDLAVFTEIGKRE